MLVLLLLSAVCARAESADPIRVSSMSDPQSVIAEQDVEITIKIFNSNPSDMEQEIALYNPEGILVDRYDGLPGEQSVSYTGTWHVTPEQIERGRIDYFIQYYVSTENGPSQTVRTIPVTIQQETAAPQLSATYSVTPTAAKAGQQVTFSYTLSNTGNVELRNIRIENPGVMDRVVTAASLSVGERVTLEDTVKMGSQEMISNPTVTYQAEGSTRELTISDMARRTITVAEDGLEATISAANTQDIYPGEQVAMTLHLQNDGNTAYTGLNASLVDGTVIASGLELAPGTSFDQAFYYTATQSGVISVQVQGMNSTGESVVVISNELELSTQDPSQALILSVQAQARETIIYSQPAVVRFAIQVENIGSTDSTTLTIKEAGTTVATIPSLPSGESRTVVLDLQASVGGQFQFVVSGRDAEGNERSYASNVMQVTYIEPTPGPTATPLPTDAPLTPSPEPEPTPVPSMIDRFTSAVEGINPTVLYAIAGVLCAVIVLTLLYLGIKRSAEKRRMANAIDVIERSSNMRDYTGEHHRRRREPAQSPAPAPKEEEQVIVPTPEWTAEEPSSEQPEHHRRPAMSVSTEETLRVVPADQRPEVPQRKVDDSQTRIYTMGAEEESALEANGQESEGETRENAEDNAREETIRIKRVNIEEMLKPEAPRNTIKNAKPMKKKKKGLFGRDDEDDFIESEEPYDGDDDDLFD